MNNIRLYLLIESSLVRLQRTCASATCVLSVHQMEAVVVENFYVNLLAQMCTDYSSRFSACGTALQGHTKSFWQKTIPVCVCLLTKFVGTCSERI